MLLRTRWSLAVLPTLLTACAGAAPSQGQASPPPPTTATATVPLAEPSRPATSTTERVLQGADESALDTGVPACEDFYEFACGGWIKNTPIPDDQSRWVRSFSTIAEKNWLALKETLEKAAAGKGDSPYSKAMGDFYASCMDEGAIEKSGLAGIADELARIDAIKKPADLTKALAHLHSIDVRAVFNVGPDADAKDSNKIVFEIEQAGLGLPDREYYSLPDPKSVQLRAAYVTHIAAVLVRGGEPAAAAKDHAAGIMRFETALAKASMKRALKREPTNIYHPMNVAQLTKLAPNFSWESYLSELGLPNTTAINVQQPEFTKAANGLVRSAPIGEWKEYLRWRLLDVFAPTLPKAFVDETFAWTQTLSGNKTDRPRWKRCTEAVDKSMGEALGIPFVKDHFGETGKKAVRAILTGVELAMKENIARIPWMDDTTREKAEAKLALVTNMVGYPDKWRNYDSLSIARDSYAKNVIAANLFESRRSFAEIGKPADKTEWRKTAPTVNAYYSPDENAMVFPAGILQPPFYSIDAIPSRNYGAIGLVIGHELTHGFDDKGRLYNGDGNLIDWWSPRVNEEFKKRAQCLVDEYNDFVAIDDVHLDGQATLGENIADLGGAKLSYAAFKKAYPTSHTTGRFTDEQQYFLGFAQAWCTTIRPEEVRKRARTDLHSLSPYRVNGPLVNLPEFAAAFSCKDGDKMVRPKEKRCEIW